jgi:hypothetical protein
MTREDKIKLAIEKGFTYDELTGKIYSRFGREITNKNDGYIRIQLQINKKRYNLAAHQFAYYYKYGKVVECIDHINRIKDDNRIENLREVTEQENMFNSESKGYTYGNCKWSKNKFKSYIKVDYKQIHLGYFNTEQEARQAYLEAKEKYHII